MEATSRQSHRSLIGTCEVHSGTFAIATLWDATSPSWTPGVNDDTTLFLELDQAPCECDLDVDDDDVPPCGHATQHVDVLGMWSSPERDVLLGLEIVFSTPELARRAAEALESSGVSTENPQYQEALQSVHRALRAEIAQWAPEHPGTVDGTVHAAQVIQMGDPYLYTGLSMSIAASGEFSLVWFLDEHGDVARLQLLAV